MVTHGNGRTTGRLWPILVPALVSSMVLATPPAGSAAGGLADRETARRELAEEPFLFEIVRHLYRWYMDEADAQKAVQSGEFTFWVQELHPQLDPGDRSRLGLILLPDLNIAVKVKRAEYEIPELDLSVKNEDFKIVNVERRTNLPRSVPEGYLEVKASYAAMRDYLFRTRNKLEFPTGDLLKSLRVAVREEIREELDAREISLSVAAPVVVHLSSLSPVANELWVFWEAGRALLRVASDVDLANPAVWELGDMAVDLYDIDEQVVVSLDEVAGSNAYMTRDQVGRALFNCVVLGKRVVLKPLEQDE